MGSHGGNPDVETIKDAGYIPAVVDASFDVYAGEILVLMGLSGSGKSTLVRCLSRLIEPTSGDIQFEGVDLLNASSKELVELRRHTMGMVFQHFALFPHRTVAENIAFPLEVQGVNKRTRLNKAHEILELVGLEGRGGYYPRELSGGQQQRVGIGRSLSADPDVWFLDEPFSALDPLIRREMQDEFLRLQQMLKKTIVFITHDFDEAIRLADRIAILFEGQIVQLGRPEDLVTNPANDYVEAFVKDVQRDKILTVGSIMNEHQEGIGGGAASALAATAPSVDVSSTIHDAAEIVLGHRGPVRVVADDREVGFVEANDIITAVYGER
jgi:glycine betaine/proline transport system ATP-binding protein